MTFRASVREQMIHEAAIQIAGARFASDRWITATWETVASMARDQAAALVDQHMASVAALQASEAPEKK